MPGTAARYGNRSVTVVFRGARYCHLRAGPTQCGLSEQVVPSLLPPSRVTGVPARGLVAGRERLRGGSQ